VRACVCMCVCAYICVNLGAFVLVRNKFIKLITNAQTIFEQQDPNLHETVKTFREH